MSLTKSITRLLRHSAVYGLGHILNRSVGFFLLPLYTHLFTQEAYGIAGLATTYLTVLTLLYCYGLDAGFMRFYILAEEGEERRRIFSSAFTTLLGSSLVISFLLYAAAPVLAPLLFSQAAIPVGVDLVHMIRLIVGILFCDTVAFIPLLLLRAEEKSSLFILLKISNGMVNLVLNVLFIALWHQGVAGIFYANLISSALLLVMVLPIILRNGWRIPHSNLVRQLLSFGLPFLPTGFAIALLDSGDRILLERLDSVAAVGVYNAGAKVGMIMALLVAAFRFAWQPYFLSTSKDQDAQTIFARIFTYILLTCVALFLVVSFFIDELVRLRIAGYSLLGESFWAGSQVVPLIMLAYLFYAMYLVFEAALYLKGKSGLIALVTLAGLAVNILANIALIPQWGPTGAAWARALAYAAMALGLLFFSQKHYYIPYEWGRLVRLALVSSGFYLLALTSPFQTYPWARLLLLSAWPFGLLVSGFFLPGEREKLRGFLSRIFVH